MAEFTYMGTKRALAEYIVGATYDAPDGPLLDLFAGLSAVGEAHAKFRNVWCNDVQAFASLYTKCMFLNTTVDVTRIGDIPEFVAFYEANFSKATLKLSEELFEEVRAISSGTLSSILSSDARVSAFCPEKQRILLEEGVHCLFATSFSGGYFSLRQSIEIDSIRAALDKTRRCDLISDEQYSWGLLMLCKATQIVSNSTGHFAQFLTPSNRNLHRVLAKRRRSVFAAWHQGMSEASPFGTSDWRKANCGYQLPAEDLLNRLRIATKRPSVIYADPPYTADQYSRYYHILETLIEYDYPILTGKGLYRPDRFVSEFSLSSKVDSAFDKLIRACGELGARLVISYPQTGLMKNSVEAIPSYLKKYFGSVCDPRFLHHQHSTMGGSKGSQKNVVSEMLFVADP